jgi:hypothetical protein
MPDALFQRADVGFAKQAGGIDHAVGHGDKIAGSRIRVRDAMRLQRVCDGADKRAPERLGLVVDRQHRFGIFKTARQARTIELVAQRGTDKPIDHRS